MHDTLALGHASDEIGAPMKGKIAFVVGLAIGYVFGTRAGRQRYEQIKSGAQKVWNSPLVRKGRDQVNTYATDLRGTVQDSVLETGRAFINAIIDRQKAQSPQRDSAPRSASTPTSKPERAKGQGAKKPSTAQGAKKASAAKGTSPTADKPKADA